MSYRVLVADDSPNIQKVVGIILSKQNYEIYDCLKYDQLDQKIAEVGPDILLLDFTLSSDVDGYQLCKFVKNKKSDMKVILLFGTFDSVDEKKVKDALSDGHLFKPFDGDKLLKLCNSLMGITAEAKSGTNIYKKAEITQTAFKIEQAKTDARKSLDAFESSDDDFGEWGVSVPGLITESTAQTQKIPEVIEHAGAPLEEDKFGGADEVTFPSDNDLAYPDEISADMWEKTVPNKKIEPDVTSKLISTENFAENLGEKTEQIDLASLHREDEKSLNDLKSMVADELEEDIWAPDEIDEQVSISPKTQELMKAHTPVIIPNTVDINQVIQQVAISPEIHQKIAAALKSQIEVDLIENIRQELKESLEHKIKNDVKKQLTESLEVKILSEIKKELSQTVKDYLVRECERSVSKEIWDILPNLAEKVIKTELEELRKSIN
jgi:CheY-like chemotaxis protein